MRDARSDFSRQGEVRLCRPVPFGERTGTPVVRRSQGTGPAGGGTVTLQARTRTGRWIEQTAQETTGAYKRIRSFCLAQVRAACGPGQLVRWGRSIQAVSWIRSLAGSSVIPWAVAICWRA
ncbi:hypothetical protein GCM10023100_00050 [Actinocorallia cavernae]|uniref:Uncharacterized protein n=1 Tax=Actinocorallia cavernae TaxID=328075 RepID=A0ABP8S6V4_9ACTN